jgi:hypothetical protein
MGERDGHPWGMMVELEHRKRQHAMFVWVHSLHSLRSLRRLLLGDVAIGNGSGGVVHIHVGIRRISTGHQKISTANHQKQGSRNSIDSGPMNQIRVFLDSA